MSVFMSRDGGVSLFRVGIFAAILGVIIVAGGFVLVEFERAGRRSPISLDLYPGAEQIHQDDISSNQRQRGFQVIGSDPETVEAVAAHYQSEMDSYYDNNPRDPNRELCTRTPQFGNFVGYEPGTGDIAYEFRCLFDDDSTYAGQRQTTVRIYPGTRIDSDPNAYNSEDFTIIVYEEFWAE